MRITRRGARADHGLSYVEINKLKYRWNPKTKTFDAAAAGPATDFSTPARHNYTIKQSLSEAAAYIKALGDDCANIDAVEFAEEFGPVLPAMIRIISRASLA